MISRHFFKYTFFSFYIIVFLCFFTQNISFGTSYLLNTPPSISKEKLKSVLNKQVLIMCFQKESEDKRKKYHLIFQNINAQTYLIIQFQGILPQKLTPQEKQKLLEKRQNNQSVWSFVYPTPPSNLYKPLTKLTGIVEENMGMMEKPLTFHKAQPQRITPKKLFLNLQNKQVIFYTGAGISAKIVPTMKQLLADLRLEPKTPKTFLKSIRRTLKNPEKNLSVMNRFYQSCLYGLPSKAHKSIKEICIQKGYGLITENIDFLHLRTGIIPLNHNKQNWLEDNVSVEDLKKIEIIITVGLHSDESGFLKWYKLHNPKGIIIAFNLIQPSYLSDQDFLVIGDVQKTIPQLQKLLDLN